MNLLKGIRQWIDFRFEKFPDFFFMCGCLSHGEKDYDTELDIRLTSKAISMWFGPSLRVDGFRAMASVVFSSSSGNSQAFIPVRRGERLDASLGGRDARATSKRRLYIAEWSDESRTGDVLEQRNGPRFALGMSSVRGVVVGLVNLMCDEVIREIDNLLEQVPMLSD